jgi:DNA-binding NtrC family response regulator
MTARPSVLLVDDDAAVLDGLALGLGERFDVRTARDGEEALERLASSPVDVVVLDLVMPRMDGCRFLHERRRRGLTTPVVIASAALDLAALSRQLGVSLYVQKPFALGALEQAIDKALGPRPPAVEPPREDSHRMA